MRYGRQSSVRILVTLSPLALRNTVLCQNISNNFTDCLTEQSAITLVATTFPVVSCYKFFRHKVVPVSPVLLRNTSQQKYYRLRYEHIHNCSMDSDGIQSSQHKQQIQQWVRKEYFRIWLTVVTLTCLYLPNARTRRHRRKYFHFGRIA